jgi:DNA-directed RNA polymerase specialized sigma24 family protein
MSIDEISAALNVPAGTVKSRLHYGREALKKSLLLEAGGEAFLNLGCEFT